MVEPDNLEGHEVNISVVYVFELKSVPVFFMKRREKCLGPVYSQKRTSAKSTSIMSSSCIVVRND